VNNLEDEFHFVLVCKQYSQLRRKYLSNYYVNNPSMDKFIQLMSSDSVLVLNRLAAYVYHALKIRNEAMYGA
jgi:hypothetical protein